MNLKPLLLLTFLPCPVLAQEVPDLWKIETELESKLETSSIVDLARQLKQTPPSTDASGAIETFLILQRAGYEKQLREVFPMVQRLQRQIGSHNLGRMADILIDRRQWTLTRQFLESAPLAEPGWSYIFLREWKAVASPDEIDLWLQSRARENRAFWVQQRFQFASDFGRLAALVAGYQNRLRENPADLESALEFSLGYPLDSSRTPELDWLGSAFKPGSASAAFQVGQALESKAPVVAMTLLQQALDLPFTESERKFMETRYAQQQRVVIHPDPEKDFRLGVKRSLLQACRSAGKTEQAQALLEELAGTSPDGFTGLSPHLAGEVQSQTGARTIENRIRQAGDREKESPEYWQNRGDYFSGRKEWEDASSSYREGLKVAKVPAGVEKPSGKGFIDGQERYRMVSSLARCLKESGQMESAQNLLLEEIGVWPANFHLTDNLVWNLVVEYQTRDHSIQINNSILWKYAQERNDWTRGVERMLRELATFAAPAERDKFWNHAESVAGTNPDHLAILGWAMNDRGDRKRGLALLEAVFQRLPEGEQREQVAGSLYGAYRDQGDWKKAEEVFPILAPRLGFEEKSDWLAGLAEAAARAGAMEDALRLWAKVVRRDRTCNSDLMTLAQLGLKPGLQSMYQALLEAEPDCTVAGEILERLNALR